MFFIRDRSIIISPACLPLHKEQNQSCAPNAPSPFHPEKHLLSSASSQLPALLSHHQRAAHSSGLSPQPKLFQTSLLWRLQGCISLPPTGSVTQLGSAGGCTGPPEHGQWAPSDKNLSPLLYGKVPRTRHTHRHPPGILAPNFWFAILCSWGIRGFY